MLILLIFIWETDFELVFNKISARVSEALFPNVGYIYLINLYTPWRFSFSCYLRKYIS